MTPPRVPDLVTAVPIVGPIARWMDAQAAWLTDLVEQNTRMVGQLPATLKSLNESLERFNETVGRLDQIADHVEALTEQMFAPLAKMTEQMEQVIGAVNVPMMRELPELMSSLRSESLPALRASTDIERQVQLLAATVDRMLAILNELPGAGMMRWFTGQGSGGGPGADPAESSAAEESSATPAKATRPAKSTRRTKPEAAE